MSRPRLAERVLFWSAAATIVAGLLVGALAMASAWPPPSVAFAFPGFHVPIALAFGGMGLLLVRRRPGNRIGWLLVLEATLTAVQFGIDQVAVVAVHTPEAWWAAWVTWISNWVWILAITPLPLVFLVFPDGRPPSRRWGRAVPVILAGAAVALLGRAFAPGTIANFPTFQNPVGFGGDLSDAAFRLGAIAMLAGSVIAVGSLVVRWRRSVGDEREQLKWLAFVGIPMVAVAGFSATVPIAADLLVGFGALMPVAIAIAVLRHRLYDIDELIGRAFVYGALTAILAGLYAAALKLFNELFVQVTGAQSESSVILATLVLAAAFTPVRKALEGVVERRFKPQPVPGSDVALPVGAALAALSPDDLERLVRRAVRAELEAAALEAPVRATESSGQASSRA